YWYSAPNMAPAGPQFGAMRPYFLSSGAEFHPPAPPAFGSAAFPTDLDEVAALSASPTAQQPAVARFLDLPTRASTAIGHPGELSDRLLGRAGEPVHHRRGLQRARGSAHSRPNEYRGDGRGDRMLGSQVQLFPDTAISSE